MLNFKALNYSPSQTAYLETVLNNVQLFTSQMTTSGLQLNWATIPGRNYQVQTCTNLPSGAWEPVTPNVPATTRQMETVIPQDQFTAEPQRFFRIMETAP